MKEGSKVYSFGFITKNIWKKNPLKTKNHTILNGTNIDNRVSFVGGSISNEVLIKFNKTKLRNWCFNLIIC